MDSVHDKSRGTTGLLARIRELDISQILARTFSTLLLGDYGADTVKLEHLSDGDDTRE